MIFFSWLFTKKFARFQSFAITSYALDLWVQQWRKRHARGEVYVVRYADDSVVCFQYKGDGENFQRALNERLAKFKLGYVA